MVLTGDENRRLKELMKPYLKDKHVLEMKRYKQHGSSSTYEHCENVVRVSYWINQRFSIHADDEALVAGAFLHDFFLYDWHMPEDRHRLHGFFHADVACKNAVKYFQISDKEQLIILCHMWPLNITRIPKNRESVIVCLADKYCSIIETFARRKKGLKICG